jgi:hypothetical protein
VTFKAFKGSRTGSGAVRHSVFKQRTDYRSVINMRFAAAFADPRTGAPADEAEKGRPE